MQRIQRSFQLMMQSYRVLMQDKELLILPVISGICILAVCISFALPMRLWDFEALEAKDESYFVLPGILFYFVTYTIGFFFQAAIVAGASERMAGGDPTVGSSLRAAWKRIGPIIVWGLIASSVGMIIRAIQDRSEIVGRIIMGIIGFAWSLATFFMVPVLVMEELPVGASFKKSWEVFKRTWGESVTATIGLGLAWILLVLPLFAVCGMIAAAGYVIPAGILGVLGVAACAVFMTALQSVWVAAAYRYATTGEAVAGFDTDTMQGAFRAKSR